MNLIVCVKRVPKTTEVDLRIDKTEKGIETNGLLFDINEWDEYALEEAVLLKEEFGGFITVVTVGSDEADSTLRECLARGADEAIRLTDRMFEGSDGYAIAKILHRAIKDLPYDLILTGAQSEDNGYSQVGPVLAELLEIPHATNVKKIEPKAEFMKVHRELEGGLGEIVEIKLPALLTIQTGINEPRYVSVISIRKAMKKEIKALSLSDLGLEEDAVGESGSWITVEKMFIPAVKKQAEILEGSIEETSSKIVQILKAKGLL